MNASDVLVESLLDWGVEVIFGLPGDGINGFVDALRTHKNRIRYIHVRHEEIAAMAACGYAKLTGKLGVCFATTGPGAIHLMNGLYDAKIDQAPVLASARLFYPTCAPRFCHRCISSFRPARGWMVKGETGARRRPEGSRRKKSMAACERIAEWPCARPHRKEGS